MKRTEIINDLRAFATQFNPFSEESGLIMATIAKLESDSCISVLQEIRKEIASWPETEPPTYVPNYDAYARCINVIDEYLAEVQDTEGSEE